MNVKEVLKILNEYPKDKYVSLGFGSPHSYRGYYDRLAVEPKSNVTVQEMINTLRSAVGKYFTGWKGGEFYMDDETTLYLAFVGNCGYEIGEGTLREMLGEDF